MKNRLLRAGNYFEIIFRIKRERETQSAAARSYDTYYPPREKMDKNSEVSDIHSIFR